MDFRFTYRRFFILIIFLLFNTLLLKAQFSSGSLGGGSDGTYSQFPMSYQLYPRNPATNFATVTFSANITATQSNVRIRVYRDDNGDGDYNDPGEEKSPILIGNSPISFTKTFSLPAELYTYRFQLAYSTNSYWLDRSFIVAGDAYYIQGQSNAEARPIEDPDGSGPLLSPDYDLANNDVIADRNFVRVYGGAKDNYSKVWGIGNANNDAYQDFNVGQFGMRIAKRIIAEHGIPVCIMNGAERGYNIDQFQRNDANHTDLTTNYGRELTRANEAGLTGSIRAIIWFQGEANSVDPYKLTTSQYKAKFNNLYNDWDEDYGVMSKYYMIQVRPGCDNGNSSPESILPIQEAERQLDNENPLMEIVSTNNLPKSNDDRCHYYFVTGYKEIGDRVYTLINRDFYGVTPPANSLTPQIVDAKFSALESPGLANEITMTFATPTDNLIINGEDATNKLTNYIRLEGGTLDNGAGYNILTAEIKNTAVSPSVNNVLKIKFSRNGVQPNPTGVTFLSKSPWLSGSTPAIVNANNIGMINFSNFPLALGILPVDPLNLRINSTEGRNTLVWEADNNPMFAQFIIERGVTANEFTAIASIQGNLKSGKVTYQQLDFKPNAARNYYRIKAIKVDGKELYSQVVAVNNRTSSVAGISVYPNPVSDRANVSLTLKKAGPATLQIFDPSGRLVATRQLNLQKGNNMFSAGELLDQSAGIYTIRVVTSEEVFNARVVRVK